MTMGLLFCAVIGRDSLRRSPLSAEVFLLRVSPPPVPGPQCPCHYPFATHVTPLLALFKTRCPPLSPRTSGGQVYKEQRGYSSHLSRRLNEEKEGRIKVGFR